MKKTYETPTVEVVEFKYHDQVVAASSLCTITNVRVGYTCKEDSNPTWTN